jgi:hypothetical protein
LEETDGRDLFGLSRFFHRRGDAPRAAKMCSKAIEAGLPAEHRQQASRELALMAKRRGDHAEAAKFWQSLLTGSQNVIEACEQLAVHFERRKGFGKGDRVRRTRVEQIALGRAANARPVCGGANRAAREKLFTAFSAAEKAIG